MIFPYFEISVCQDNVQTTAHYICVQLIVLWFGQTSRSAFQRMKEKKGQRKEEETSKQASKQKKNQQHTYKQQALR